MATLQELEAEMARRQGMAQPPTASVLQPEQKQVIDGQTTDRIAQEAEIKRRQEAELPPQKPELPAEKDGISKAGQAILDIPGGAAVSEFTSAVNRGTINLIDMLGPDFINNALSVAGIKARVPTLGEQKIVQEATTGQFMEPGLAKEAVRTGGEFVAPVGAAGSVIRGAAAQVPKLVAPTVAQRVVQTAATPAIPELGAGALAGAGSEVGAETGGAIGEAVGGEEGRKTGEQIGRLTGGVLVPVGATLAKETGKTLVSQSAKKLLSESAPTIEGLKKAARSVYNDLENSGVSINSNSVRKLAGSLSQVAKQKGFHGKIHPKVGVALNEFKTAAESGTDLKLSEIDNLRRIMGSAAKSLEPDEARIGVLLSNRVDDWLDNLNKANFSKAFNKDVGAKYKDARQLWRRVKKSEQLAEAFDKAQLQASGFENGIRTQFRSILNSKKNRKGFTPDELKAMKEVVQGTSLQNMAKLLGRFGFGEGQASNMLMGYAGIAGGAAVGGPVGAVVVPSIGQLSRKLAQRLTREGAKNADLMVRAGKNGTDIVKTYMKITPPKERTAQELTELLLRPDINLEGLKQVARSMPQKNKQLINDATFLVNAIKATQKETDQ